MTAQQIQIKNIFILGIACLVVLGLDQFTKILVLQEVQLYEIKQVIPGFFNLTLTYNKGIAFGFLSGVPDEVRSWLLVATTSFALILVCYFMFKEYAKHFGSQIALIAIVGGAIGNIIDRFRLGKVVDFLDFYVGNYHWPAFNIADSAICISVLYLVLFSPKLSSGSKSQAVESTAADETAL